MDTQITEELKHVLALTKPQITEEEKRVYAYLDYRETCGRTRVFVCTGTVLVRAYGIQQFQLEMKEFNMHLCVNITENLRALVFLFVQYNSCGYACVCSYDTFAVSVCA